MLRLDMEAVGASVGRAIGISFPTASAIVLIVLMGWIGAAVVWRWIAPWRERVRVANDENDRKQRK
jgi:hypothetical protein